MSGFYGARKIIRPSHEHKEEEYDDAIQGGNDSYDKTWDEDNNNQEDLEAPPKKITKKASTTSSSSSSSKGKESDEDGFFDIGAKRRVNVKGKIK